MSGAEGSAPPLLGDLAIERRRWERSAVHAAVWGHQAPYLLVELADAPILDPWCRQVRTAVIDAVTAGTATGPGLVQEVARRGEVTLAELVMVDVTEAGGRLDGLPHYLARIGEDHRRRAVGLVLAGLVHSLGHPGGLDRVTRVLHRGLAAA